MYKELMKSIREYKKPSILSPIFVTIEVLMECIIPFYVAELVNQIKNGCSIDVIVKYGCILVVMAGISLAGGVLAGSAAATASSGFARNLRKDIFYRIQNYSFENIDKFSTPSLVTRMTTDITNVQMAYMMIIRVAVRCPLMLVFSFVMAFVMGGRMASIFLIVAPILGIGLGLVVWKTMPLFRKVFRKYDALNNSIQENVRGMRVVKSFVREDYENQKFRRAAESLYKLFVKAESRLALNSPVMMLIVYGCMLAISWFGARFIVAGDLTTGQLTSLFSYVLSVLMSLMMLSMVFVMLTMSLASARRIAQVLHEQPDLADPQRPVTQVENGSIDFDHVSFSYKHGTGDQVLQDVDLHIRSGETIGVIGGTGSGKSTFANLISRLYDVDTGTVKVGGVDVRRYDMEALRNQVAVVLQKNVLFSGTILDNLRWGKEDATLEECQAACQAACADEFINRFPEGYNTWIEQGGTNVSGGQKQRLCIARALLKRPKVLILDDSTSAVDTATDSKIRQAFASSIPGTTKIIIAQRVSSVQDADRILVLDNGRVNGFGTHQQLLENNKIYQEIYQAQTQGGGDFDQAQGE